MTVPRRHNSRFGCIRTTQPQRVATGNTNSGLSRQSNSTAPSAGTRDELSLWGEQPTALRTAPDRGSYAWNDAIGPEVGSLLSKDPRKLSPSTWLEESSTQVELDSSAGIGRAKRICVDLALDRPPGVGAPSLRQVVSSSRGLAHWLREHYWLTQLALVRLVWRLESPTGVRSSDYATSTAHPSVLRCLRWSRECSPVGFFAGTRVNTEAIAQYCNPSA